MVPVAWALAFAALGAPSASAIGVCGTVVAAGVAGIAGVAGVGDSSGDVAASATLTGWQRVAEVIKSSTAVGNGAQLGSCETEKPCRGGDSH